jgi:uncharacterized protein (DUF1501 family)
MTPKTFRADLSRRDFLRRLGLGTATAVGAGYGLSVWEWGGTSAGAAPLRAGSLGDANGHTLIVVELGGGNDGLNTLVPHADAAYLNLRPTLGVKDSIDLDGHVGLHPKLAKLAKRFKDGHVAAIEGIGYDDPDLSHFGSSGIWWSAKGGTGGGGWLGTYLDGTVGFDDPLAAVGIGPGPSPALIGRKSFATTIADTTGLQPNLPPWADNAGEVLAAWHDLAPAKIDSSKLIGQVQRAVGLSADARRDLDRALSGVAASSATPDAASAQASYQDTSVADSLALAAELVLSPAKPRVIFVNGVGDFDTHQGEAQRHPALMAQLDDGIDRLFTRLGGHGDNVVLMTTSEFGRRPAENGSGTDHGTANVHFVVGPAVKGGRYGEPPSLTKLDVNGNLVSGVDFRRLYATGLAWLGAEAKPVLGERFETFNLF